MPENSAVFSDRKSKDLLSDYLSVRALSERLASPLSREDQTIQSMPDASPTKWHLAHTSWFFETFILCHFDEDYVVFDDHYRVLFNSYYNQIGEQYPRHKRGLITRPTVEEMYRYRRYVDKHISQLIARLSPEDHRYEDVLNLVVLGLNHEQQHQELIVTDIKHAFSLNPTNPVYCKKVQSTSDTTSHVEQFSEIWDRFEAGIYRIGFRGEGFHFDNEAPVHRVFQESFKISTRLVTNAEYLAFMDSGGYRDSSYWLSEGWSWVIEKNIQSPLYWQRISDVWTTYTLNGRDSVCLEEPVIHLSYFEADAFARWQGYRLPTEQEWEIAASDCSIEKGQHLDTQQCHPTPAYQGYFGNAWCWTSSAYSAYPGFETSEGAVGEYNGKFMCNQYVLRGGSCATPLGHIRTSYRNFFPADTRWQFSGVRLATDA